MPLTIKSNTLDLLAEIDYLSAKADSEGYGDSSLRPAIDVLIGYSSKAEYSDDDDIEVTDNFIENTCPQQTLHEIVVRVNGKEILRETID